MEKARLGKAGPMVTRLGLGSIPIGAKECDYATAEAVLNRALDLGINLVDTSWNYGQAEGFIGRALSRRRREFVLISKTGKRTREGARAELEHAMGLLQAEHLDAYMLHSVSRLSVWNEVMARGGAYEALQQAKDEGLIGRIGISIHRDLRVMRNAIESGRFEIMMVAYNVLDQENTASEIIPLAQERGISVLLMKVLGGGALVPTPEMGLTKQECHTVVRDCARYGLANTNVTSALIGCGNVQEVEQVVAAASMPAITREEQDRLVRQVGRMKREFRYGQTCLRCHYCQPCPNGIPIPDVFRAADMYRAYADELKPIAVEMYDELHFDPAQCDECRQCVEKCPAGIDIPERLKQVAKAFATGNPDLA